MRPARATAPLSNGSRKAISVKSKACTSALTDPVQRKPTDFPGLVRQERRRLQRHWTGIFGPEQLLCVPITQPSIILQNGELGKTSEPAGRAISAAISLTRSGKEWGSRLHILYMQEFRNHGRILRKEGQILGRKAITSLGSSLVMR